MSNQDQEYMRCLFAGFKAVTGADAEECFRFADEMMKAKNKGTENAEKGIAAIKKRRLPRES